MPCARIRNAPLPARNSARRIAGFVLSQLSTGPSRLRLRERGLSGYLAGPRLALARPPMPAPPSPVEAAAALLGAGRPGEAAGLLRPYVDEMPGYAGALVVYARALELSGDLQGALAAWHRAYFFAPDSPLVRRARARLLRQADPLADAAPAVPTGDPASDSVREVLPAAEAGPTGASDLDALIEQLENAPRIRPDDPFDDDAPLPSEPDGEALVSETMASILAAQGRHAEAARMYERLAEQRPDGADAFREKARALRDQATA